MADWYVFMTNHEDSSVVIIWGIFSSESNKLQFPESMTQTGFQKFVIVLDELETLLLDLNFEVF